MLNNIIKKLLEYSFSEIKGFQELTPREKAIVETEENFKALQKWSGDSTKYIEAVQYFMGIIGQDRPEAPTIPTDAIVVLRKNLIEEENKELQEAAYAGDIVEIADALCDLRVVVEGAAIAYGFSPELMDELFDEVQRSNLSKTCATEEEAEQSITALYDAQAGNNEIKMNEVHNFSHKPSGDRWVVFRKSDNKVLKGINYSEPNLRPILERHGVKC